MKEAATHSERETQSAEMIAWGLSKKAIANILFLSERTVENHTRMIYKKIGVSKSNELSAWWFCTRYNISETPLFIISITNPQHKYETDLTFKKCYFPKQK